MCPNYAKHLSLFLPVLFIASAATAQNTNKENAPYSRYGIGELLTGTNVMLRGMGYTSTAYNSGTAVNSENPASYSFIRVTTYEGGLSASARTIKSGKLSYTTGTASLAYLNVGIPLGKHAGMALGLKPQSHVYFHSVDTASTPGIGKTASEYNGEGGLNYAYIGGAANYKGFSLGFNFGYMFGTIRNTSRLVNLDTTHVLNTDFSSFTKIGGIYWKGGAQYQKALTKRIGVRLGATATISQDLNASRDDYQVGFHYSSGSEVQDTAYKTSGLDGKVKLPMSYSVGAGIFGTNWGVYTDFTGTKWSQYRSYDVMDSVADQTMRFSIGGEYTPDPTNVRSYLSRVTYRLGFYYGSDYVKLHNTDINYYAITAGASFPFKKSGDKIHLALEVGRHGTETNNLVLENYFRFHVGISLNDKWFIKRKYD